MPDAFTKKTVQKRAAFWSRAISASFSATSRFLTANAFHKLFGHFHRVLLGFAHDVGMSFSPFTSQSAADFENIVLAPSISISWATLVGFVKCDVARTVRIRLSAAHLPGLTRKNSQRDGAAIGGYLIAERSSDRRQVSG